MATVIAAATGRNARAARRGFYVGLALLIAAIIAAGFSRSFYGTFVGGVAHPWIIHVHAGLYVGWLVLLIAQAALAARGRIALHRRLGNFGIAYGVLVFLLGLVVAVAMPVINVRAGLWNSARAETFLAIPLVDMLLYGGLFAAAIACRRRPEIHKRLIVLAAVAIMFAAVNRALVNAGLLAGNAAAFTGTVPQLALWYSPVLVAMAHDLVTRRSIHPVYWIGAFAMAISLLRLPYSQTEQWHGVARRVLAPFM
ncbi:MAG TPA: hypothetical protein VHH11_05425 [Gammaproteobacteria bacterium]|jgi:hypothetical protein|nr:hypothetical protein [Gammaproteobacteria bacterium]